ncbi:MAG TPA: FtsX-like permease family protein, partial [Pirellulaceae bacterium]|nr:FtsX-like permease family protein [Pirellulaceae bacterium]
MVALLSMLDRKLLRDLNQIKSQSLAIALVMAAGIAMLVMSLFARDALHRSKEAFYARYRFADVFASAKRAPRSIAHRLEQIPGVAVVAPRIVANVSLDVPDMNEPAMGRLISIPDTGRAPLNDVYLKSGRLPDPHQAGEILGGEAFCQAHQLQPGATIRAVINGRLQELTIVGIALSPEYLIQIQPGSLLPDDRRFGVFWMCQRQLAAAYNMEGAFNDVSLTVEPGTQVERVIDDVDRLLEPFGGIGSYARDHQTSNQYITDEIRQLSTMATLAPAIFLSVAAFLINVVISRQIGLQREQIAALKAFGYSNTAVGWHYLKMVIAIALVGTLIGFTGGLHLARGLTRLYAELYRFPSFDVVIHPWVVLIAVGVSVGAAASGAWWSIRRAARLPPAESMRPEPPANFRPTVFERLAVGRWMPLVLRMILRNLERRPLKSLSAILGIAMAVSVLIVGSFSLDAVNYMMDFQFRWGQRQTLNFTVVEPVHRNVVHEIASWRGVTGQQMFRAAAVRLSRGHRWRRVGVLGLDQSQDLFRLLSTDRRPYRLPRHGLVLSEKLAEILDVQLGESVMVSVMEGKRPTRDIEVVGVIQEYGGLNAYMSLEG